MMPANASAQVLCDSLYASAHAMHIDDPLRAGPLFQLLARLMPTDERGWLGIGACHEALDVDDVALSVYTFGQAAARSARCVAARARVLTRLGREDDAVDVIEHALSLSWAEDEQRLLERERALLP